MFKSLLKTRLAAFGAYYSGAARRRGGKKKKSGTGSKVLYGLRFGHKDAADEHERKGHQRVKREIQPREVRSAEGPGQRGE